MIYSVCLQSMIVFSLIKSFSETSMNNIFINVIYTREGKDEEVGIIVPLYNFIKCLQ